MLGLCHIELKASEPIHAFSEFHFSEPWFSFITYIFIVKKWSKVRVVNSVAMTIINTGREIGRARDRTMDLLFSRPVIGLSYEGLKYKFGEYWKILDFFDVLFQIILDREWNCTKCCF